MSVIGLSPFWSGYVTTIECCYAVALPIHMWLAAQQQQKKRALNRIQNDLCQYFISHTQNIIYYSYIKSKGISTPAHMQSALVQ